MSSDEPTVTAAPIEPVHAIAQFLSANTHLAKLTDQLEQCQYAGLPEGLFDRCLSHIDAESIRTVKQLKTELDRWEYLR